MPDNNEVRRMQTPKLHRLKELGEGVRVDRVLGDRVLIKTVIPLTELDEHEKKGLIIPSYLKKEYTPMPTTGVVLAVGDALQCKFCGNREGDPMHWRDHPFQPAIAPGDLVLFSRLSGMDFTIAEQDLRIIQTKEILAVLSDTDGSVMEVKDAE